MFVTLVLIFITPFVELTERNILMNVNVLVKEHVENILMEDATEIALPVKENYNWFVLDRELPLIIFVSYSVPDKIWLIMDLVVHHQIKKLFKISTKMFSYQTITSIRWPRNLNNNHKNHNPIFTIVELYMILLMDNNNKKMVQHTLNNRNHLTNNIKNYMRKLKMDLNKISLLHKILKISNKNKTNQSITT
jgi:hypothetical protein